MVQLPGKLIDSLIGSKGFNSEAFEGIHHSGKQVVSIRLNPAKPVPGVQAMERVPWCENGFYLSERPSFTLDPVFHAGAYYVQEASSMFLEYLLKQILKESHSLNALDLCAAPGGKSTLLASLPFFKLVVANELIKTRVNVLHENLVKWGAPHAIITNNDPRDFKNLPGFFDVMVIDAPCSGSGLFRKDPDAISEWSERNVQLCSERQQRILADALPALKQDGYLIYSTCSYSKEEDEEILDWLGKSFEMETVRISVPEEWGVVETVSPILQHFGYRFYPDRLKGEGLFIACLKKKAEAPELSYHNKKVHQVSRREKELLARWLRPAGEWGFIKLKDDFFVMPGNISQDYNKLEERLSVRRRGTRLGALIREELIPDHELALSTIIADNVPFTEMNDEMALNYLRKQEIRLENQLTGWVLVKHKGLNLGWIKGLIGRINNYYPAAWRILKQ